jgi:transposase-like protein
MSGRKRHSAEDIVRKLRQADELAAGGATGEQVAAELGVPAATLYNWRLWRDGHRCGEGIARAAGAERTVEAAAG